MVGPESEPGYQRVLEQGAAELGLAEQIIFAGPLSDEARLQALADADLFVLPSMNENFGNVIAEAVAAGLPVLITDRCGIAPPIRGRVGLVVPYNLTEHCAMRCNGCWRTRTC